MSIFCWKCNREMPDGMSICPHCEAPVAAAIVNQMETIVDNDAARVQIMTGVTVAGRYEIRREIGRGGMGIVYLAFDRTLEREIALKVIPHELCQDPRAIQNLKRETTIALDLTHSNIIRLYNLETWEGQAFVTMEYVTGQTLAHFLAARGGSLTFAEARPRLREIATALDYAHSKNPPVVHRDLKPLNILMTSDGQAKIGDYGLARVLQDSATRISMSQTAGTLAYMAPEQIRGKGIGPWTDIYAFACLTCEILTGEPPFTTGDLRWQIIHEEPELSPDLSATEQKALLCGLAKDPPERPVSAGALVEMLAGERPPAACGVGPESTKSSASKAPAPPAAGSPQNISSNVPEALKPSAASETGKTDHTEPPDKSGNPKKSNGRGLLWGLLILLLMAASGFGWWWTNNSAGMKAGNAAQPRAAAPPAAPVAGTAAKDKPVALKNRAQTPKTVRQKAGALLYITSTPSGADIYIDGGLAGTTPLNIMELVGGTHAVKLVKERYIDYENKVFVQKGKTMKVAALLEPKPFGDLKVTSNPEGAEVYLDGKKLGTTPLSRKNLKKGRRQLELKKPYYGTKKRAVEIVPLKNTEIDIELGAPYGNLKLTSTPTGAAVYLDGKKVGVTPLNMSGVKSGEKRLELKKLGYKKVSQLITVKAGHDLRLAPVLKRMVIVEPVTGMELIWIPGGCFQMGSPSGEEDLDSDEDPIHKVCVDGFWMGKYEVTQGQWRKVMGSNPSRFKKGDNYPVEQVSWNECREFIEKLNRQSGRKFRLPTEAEWEYACRAGTTTPFSFGSTISTDQANYNGNYTYGNGRKGVYRQSTAPVGSFAANPFGLYDMHGNVWEWCADWYGKGYYKNSPTQNPRGPGSGSGRVNRGGGWGGGPGGVRSAVRDGDLPGFRGDDLGFRLVASGRR